MAAVAAGPEIVASTWANSMRCGRSSLPKTRRGATASASRIDINCDSASRRRSVGPFTTACRSILILLSHEDCAAVDLSTMSCLAFSPLVIHRPLYLTRPWTAFSSSLVSQAPS